MSHVSMPGVPVEVDPLLIERELAALWKPASEEQGGEGAVVRACLTNLVVFVPQAARLELASTMVQEIFRGHPNRTILLVLDAGKRTTEGRRSRLDATITTLCSFLGRSAPVCCEQITLRAHPDDARLLEGAVAPLLVPDIPVALWWLDELAHPTLPRLAASADRLIVDSRRTGLRAVARIATSSAAVVADTLVDLDWERLGRWRRVLAELWEDEGIRSVVGRTDRVEIDVAGDDPRGGGDGGALLAGWLVSRLESLGAPPRVERRKRDVAAASSPGGEPVAIRLRAGGDSFVSVEATSAGCARVDFSTATSCRVPRTIPFARRPDAAILGDVLDRPPSSGAFLAALEAAKRFLDDAGTP